MNIWTRCGLTSSELPCTHFFMAWENMEPKREERSGCISEIINESLPPNCRLHLTSSRWVNIFQSRWSHSLIWYRTILHVVGSKEQRRKRFFNISEESELWGQQEQQLHELYIHGSTVDVFIIFFPTKSNDIECDRESKDSEEIKGQRRGWQVERRESQSVTPLDFFTSGSGSASLINWPISFTFPNVILLTGQRRRMKTNMAA